MRLCATNALFERRDVIIVASVSCIYGIGAPETYYSMSFRLAKGQAVTRKKIVDAWSRSSTSGRRTTSSGGVPCPGRHHRRLPGL